MEKKLGVMFFLFVIILLLQFSEPRRTQRPLQGDNEDKGNKNDNWAWARGIQADRTSEVAQELSLLMGEEKCEDRDDEECTKRRMITESHLDYIYTQSHNKP